MRGRVDVIGAGALGLGFGVSVSQRGHSVRVRSRHGVLCEGRLWIGATEVQASFVPIPHDDADCIILGVKAYDLEGVLSSRGSSTLGARAVVCIQNGLGISEQLPPGVPGLRAIVTACAERTGQAEAKWRDPIAVTLDASAPIAEFVASLLQSPWIRVTLSSSFQADVFRKLLVNAAINPLTAIHGIDCLTLLKERELVERAHAVAREILGLAHGLGIELSVSAERTVDSALRFMGRFRPSMLQDLSAGRQVEIDAILGEPIRLARRLGVPVPALTDTYHELSSIAKAWAEVSALQTHAFPKHPRAIESDDDMVVPRPDVGEQITK